MLNTTIQGNQNATLLLNQLKKSCEQYKNLSKKEERELIEKYRNDRETLNKLLCMHNLRLVFNMAKKYMSKTTSFDDLIQDGIIGLMEATTRFDIDKDIKFCTYAYMWIMKYMTMTFYGKQVELDKASTSLSSPNLTAGLKSNNGTEVTLENYVNEFIEPTTTVYSISAELDKNEQVEICNKLMKELEKDTSLTATEKAVFTDLFYNRDKPKELAEKYDMTLKHVHDIKKNVLSKFKDILVNDYKIASYQDLSDY